MKKITFLAMFIASLSAFAEKKSTGDIVLTTNMTVNLTLDNLTQKATIKLSGPSDRWFALQFGAFGAGNGMMAGEDLIYANATTIVDASHNGVGSAPSTDATQNWVVVSDVTVSTTRTLTVERSFSTGDAKDYTFDYNNSTIDFVWARRSSAGYTLNYHGANKGYNVLTPLSTSLGIDDFSLKAASIYPNPSKGNFSIETKTGLDAINVYSQTGALLETIGVDNQLNKVEVSLKNSQKGIYLLELKNGNDKTWKKVIVE